MMYMMYDVYDASYDVQYIMYISVCTMCMICMMCMLCTMCMKCMTFMLRRMYILHKYMMYMMYMNLYNGIMQYESPYAIYHIFCLLFHVLHLKTYLTSYIVDHHKNCTTTSQNQYIPRSKYHNFQRPYVSGWEKTSCKAADGGAALFGSNFGGYLDVFS